MNWTVPGDLWKDNPVIILGGGPSINSVNLSKAFDMPDIRIITLNDAWRLVPSSLIAGRTINYFCDSGWWSQQLQYNLRSTDYGNSFHDMIYKGFWVTISPMFDEHPQVHALNRGFESGLSLNPTFINHGYNSGYQAINLAVLLGSKKIILVGYDMRLGEDRRTHWFGGHGMTPEGFESVMRNQMLPMFPSLIAPLKKAGVRIINASPGTALTCFDCLPLEKALEKMKGTHA